MATDRLPRKLLAVATSIGMHAIALGTRAYEVEWCSDLGPVNEFGETELDSWVYERRICATRESAMDLAKKLLPLDKVGAVAVTEVEYADPYGDNLPHTFRWEYVGETEHVEE